MTIDFKLQLTDIGLAKQAAANAGGDAITLTKIAVGDGNGDYYTLDSSMTALVNEFYRFAFVDGDLEVDPVNKNKIKMEGHIPATQGGQTTREIGIFDDQGDMIAHGLFPAIDIPTASTGARVDVYVKEYLEVSNSSLFEMIVDSANAVISKDTFDEHKTDPAAHNSLFALKADKNGDNSEVFAVANAENANDAVPKGQLIALIPDVIPNDIFQLKAQVNSTDTNNDIDFIVGSYNRTPNAKRTAVRSFTAGSFVKQADVNFSIGSDAGGFIPYDTETIKGANKSYAQIAFWNSERTAEDFGIIHVSAFNADGETLSENGLTELESVTGWTIDDNYIRVGSKITDANGYWIPDFVLEINGGGIVCLYQNQIQDITITLASGQTYSATAKSLTIPKGIKSRAILSCDLTKGSAGIDDILLYLSDPDCTSINPPLIARSSGHDVYPISTISTNTNAEIIVKVGRIYTGASNSMAAIIYLNGFVEGRRAN